MAANEPLNELSTTDASNTPVGTDVIGATLDDELRSIKANIARSARWEQTATQSAAVTLAVSSLHKLFPVEGSVGGSTTITLPEVASAGAGFSVAFKKIDNVNNVIIDGNGGEQIDGAASRTMKAQYEGLVLVCNGSSWDVAADGERLVVPNFTVDGALNTSTLFVDGNEVTGLEGTVPTPANPGEDDYLLEASGGTWAWQSPANVKTNLGLGALADLSTVDTAQIDASAVETAKINDNAVTLAKLEDGTEGDILYYASAGAPTRLAKGSDAEVLTLASGLPSWAAVSSPTSYGFHTTVNATDATNDIDITAGQCWDTTRVSVMQGSAMTKQADVAWSAGTNGGFIDTGSYTTVGYYFYAMISDVDGSVDYIMSTSETWSGVTKPTNYTKGQLIGYGYPRGGPLRWSTVSWAGNYCQYVDDGIEGFSDATITSSELNDYTLAPVPHGCVGNLQGAVIDDAATGQVSRLLATYADGSAPFVTGGQAYFVGAVQTGAATARHTRLVASFQMQVNASRQISMGCYESVAATLYCYVRGFWLKDRLEQKE